MTEFDDPMRLWYHPESDSLFWHDEYPCDPLVEDVTHDLTFRTKAQNLVTTPVNSVPYDHMEDITFGDKRIGDLRVFMAFNGNVTPETAAYSGRDTREPNWSSKPVEVTSKGIAGAIVKSYKRWERKPADLYPTPVDATESLMPILKAAGAKRVWEPACGDGRMARVLEWHGLHVDATDIRETPGFGYGGLDFVNDDPMTKWGWEPHPDWIVTNPPFSLAEQFIRKALSITPNVAMLVKQSYWNTKGRLTFFGEHRPKFFLPVTWRLAFLPERGQSPIMDCAWCVWTEQGDEEVCAFEPLPKRVYPGYRGKGLRGALASCEEALAELADACRARADGLVEQSRSDRAVAEATSEDDDDI